MPLAPGLVGEHATTVDEPLLASSVGSGSLAVLSTPSLIALMERAAHAAVEPHLAAEQTTVGVRVDVRHLAATPPGARVRARATLLQVDGRRLIFEVVAFDHVEKIGEGTHERSIVDAARLLSRATTKKAP